MEMPKVYVTEKTIYCRLNRKLKHQGLKLRMARNTNTETSVGRYFAVDIEGNYVAQTFIDLGGMAKDLGVLRAWEEVAA
jgi:hypothetical protein